MAASIAPESVFDGESFINEYYGAWSGMDEDRILVVDRKKAEEELQASERNLRQFTNAIPTNIHVLRPDGSVLYVNQPGLDYTGLTMADVLKGDYCARVFHPEDLERIREERRDSLTHPVLFENEQRALGKDGKYRWFLARYNLQSGLPVHLVNHLTTMADLHRAGRYERMSNDVLTLTGQGPLSLQEFVRKNAATFTASAKVARVSADARGQQI